MSADAAATDAVEAHEMTRRAHKRAARARDEQGRGGQVCRRLIAPRTALDAKDDDQQTALHLAAAQGHAEVVVARCVDD